MADDWPTSHDPRDFEKGRQYGDLTIGFIATKPYRTWGLKVYYPEDAPPARLFNALEMIGWQRSEMGVPAPFEGRAEASFHRDGSAIFNSWTEAEQKAFMTEVRATLKRFGYTYVPKIRLTLEDLL